jgi:prepilin-type N-terminal cleavage/methylation domain-containing protein
MTTSNGRWDFGFSLIEILVALVILAILVTLSIITLAPFQRSVKTDDAAGVLYTLMRQGRLQAITRRQFYAVVINLATSDQNVQLNNSTKSLRFLAQSITLVDMGRSSVQNDEEITFSKKLPRDIIINAQSNLPDKTVAFPSPERSFLAHNFSTGSPSNLFACYFDPAGRVVNSADGAGTQEYKIFYFSAPDINLSKSPTLLRAITLYGATGGLKFWRYNPSTSPGQWVGRIS